MIWKFADLRTFINSEKKDVDKNQPFLCKLQCLYYYRKMILVYFEFLGVLSRVVKTCLWFRKHNSSPNVVPQNMREILPKHHFKSVK